MAVKMQARQFIKIRGANENNLKNLDVDIQVDGGVKASNIAEIAECGANIFVCGSAVFEGNIEKNVKEILEQMNK